MKCRLSIGFSLLFYVSYSVFKVPKDPHNLFHLLWRQHPPRSRPAVLVQSPSRTGLPTIHCFKRLEATSGVTSGLYCRPSLRSVVERFFHFPSSSSDVPVIPTSSPLSPDGKHRRTSPSTASGNPPAPVTSVPVSPLPPHRTKPDAFPDASEQHLFFRRPGLPHRLTDVSGKRLSPQPTKERVRIVPFRQPDPHRIHSFACKRWDNRIRRLAPRLVGIQHHADRCRISFQQSNVPPYKAPSRTTPPYA